MLLQRLVEFYHQIQDELPPDSYKEGFAKFRIVLNLDGTFVNIEPFTEEKKGLAMQLPCSARTSGIAPFPLADKVGYVLGLEVGKKENKRKEEMMDSFVELIDSLVDSLGEKKSNFPEILAVQTFYKSPEIEKAKQKLLQLEEGMKITDSDNIVFFVNFRYVHTLRPVISFWGEKNLDSSNQNARKMECMISGEVRPIVETHPVQLSILGQRPILVSANSKAYESYGLKRSEIAPTSMQSAFEYGQALRYLSSSPKYKMSLGGILYLFWTKQKDEPFNILQLLTDPSPEHVKELLQSPFRGTPSHSLDSNDFYIVGLSAQKTRLIVRDYMESSLESIQRHLSQWFLSQELVHATTGELGRFQSIFSLAKSLVRDGLKELSPNFLLSLLHRSLFNTPLTLPLIAQIMRRAKTNEYAITYPSAVLLKIVLNDYYSLHPELKEKKQVTAQLNPNEERPAYLCGRLFAILEKVQKTSVGKTTSTITERYFGTASSAPASVFGNLLRLSQTHLQKLRKNKGGAYYSLQEDLEEVMSKLTSFPKTLTLESQGLFSIGYYHQKADFKSRWKNTEHDIAEIEEADE